MNTEVHFMPPSLDMLYHWVDLNEANIPVATKERMLNRYMVWHATMIKRSVKQLKECTWPVVPWNIINNYFDSQVWVTGVSIIMFEQLTMTDRIDAQQLWSIIDSIEYSWIGSLGWLVGRSYVMIIDNAHTNVSIDELKGYVSVVIVVLAHVHATITIHTNTNDNIHLHSYTWILCKDAHIDIMYSYCQGNNSYAMVAHAYHLESGSRLIHKGELVSHGAVIEQYIMDDIGNRSDIALDMRIRLKSKANHVFNAVQHHRSPFTKSSVHMRSVLEGASRVWYDGSIVIEQSAPNTIARQLHKNLTVTTDATHVYTRPVLEILNNQVSCSHGAASTYLDDVSLWYFAARGIELETAKDLLVDYFLR